jgi:hypothetical protein
VRATRDHMSLEAYGGGGSWALVLREEVAAWLGDLSEGDYRQVLAALDALAVDGPALGRPFVDTMKGSRHANMKELRPRGGNLRLLFAFDTERLGIVLVAGDKTNNWTRWYRADIPSADEPFQEHLEHSAAKTRKGRGR